jgi:hypothetical protein
VRLERFPIEVGISPPSWKLSYTQRVCNCPRFPIDAGIRPETWVLLIHKKYRFDKFPISEGMPPDN